MYIASYIRTTEGAQHQGGTISPQLVQACFAFFYAQNQATYHAFRSSPRAQHEIIGEHSGYLVRY